MNKLIKLLLLIAFLIIPFSLLFTYFTHKNIRNKSQGLNLVIISFDTLRSDHMGVYGYGKNTTPNIDKWAKDAMVFTNAITTIPQTYPSFSELMTGQEVLDTRIYYNTVDRPLSTNVPTLAKILKKNKYTTAAFLTNEVLDKNITHLNMGFDIYSMNKSFGNVRHPDYFTHLNETLAWLEKNKSNKFFLWFHLTDPHNPYTPSDDKACKFDESFCPYVKTHSVEEMETKRGTMEDCQPNGIPKWDLDLYRTLYDGEIAQTDENAGKIIDKLRTLGLDKNTIVVVLSDHGESFDHNYYFNHGLVVNQSTVHTALIIKDPLFKTENKKSDHLITNTDTSVTILDLLGIDPKTYHSDGISYSNLFYNDIISKITYKPRQQAFLVNRDLSKYALYDGRYKFIFSISDACLYNRQTEELFDLSQDADEINNLIKVLPEKAKIMEDTLLKYLVKYNLPRSSKSTNTPPELDIQHLRETLKSMGY